MPGHSEVAPRILLLLFYFQVSNLQARVFQKVDNAIHWINHYPANSVVWFVNTYPLESNLSGG